MTTCNRRLSWLGAILIGLTLSLAMPSFAMGQSKASDQSAPKANAPTPDNEKNKTGFPAKAQPILPLDQVKIGAKGYGLTVFHGAKIEAFPVEVISVMRDFAPKRGAIWIRCSDPRLQQSGPVQGMSGSPIYLWEDGEKQEVGKGGKLIGAFAFGYSWTHDCYAGVQPIELMRETGGRAIGKDVNATTKAARAARRRAAYQGEALRAMLTYAKQEGWKNDVTWRAEILAKLTGVEIDEKSDNRDADNANKITRFAPTNLKADGKPFRLMLPMAVSSGSQAKWLTPMLAPMGIRPMAGPIGVQAGLPPKEINPQKLRLEPGSVLSLPLAWGDADLNAAGTVTDVLPDGKVLGFGHAMFGEGDIALPMATGFVHFIVPRLSTSFKLGGTAVIQGSIVRDENAAVAGVRKQAFKTSPVNVTVVNEGRRTKYTYTMVQHDRLAPALAGQLAAQSIEADTKLPMESTVKLAGTALFEGGRKVELQSLIAPAAASRVMSEVLPAVGSMVQNTHKSMMLQSLDLELHVTPKIQAIQLLSARIEKSEVEPGEKVKVTMNLQARGESPTQKTIFVQVPDSLSEGRYPVSISDGRTYLQQTVQNRPHLMETKNEDDVFHMVKMVTAVRTDAFYVVLQMPRTGLAIGRRELPRLPSSRKILIQSAANQVANSYADTVETIVPMNAVVVGRVGFVLTVRKPNSSVIPAKAGG